MISNFFRAVKPFMPSGKDTIPPNLEMHSFSREARLSIPCGKDVMRGQLSM